MAIARDTSTNFGGGSGTTTVTYANYPMAATSTGLLCFGMYGVNGASDTCTGATFNGVSMTKLAVRAPGYRWAYLFYLVGATGTHDIVVSFSADPGGSDGAGFSYTGVSQGAIDSSNTNTVSSAALLTNSTTVVASNAWLGGFFLDNTGGSGQTVGAGTSQIHGSGNFGIYDSNGVVGTGSQSLIVNQNSSGPWGGTIISFAPAVLTLTISASDSTAVSDIGKLSEVVSISSPSDSSTIGDSISIQLAFAISVLDATTVTDIVSPLQSPWPNLPRSSSSWSGGTKDSSIWTDLNRDSSSFVNQVRS